MLELQSSQISRPVNLIMDHALEQADVEQADHILEQAKNLINELESELVEKISESPADMVQLHDHKTWRLNQAREELSARANNPSQDTYYAPIQDGYLHFIIEHASKDVAAITTILDNVKVWTYE